MRKLKNWLLTAGIAAVMATGVAVGAHLTTNDAPLRTEAATTYDSYSKVAENQTDWSGQYLLASGDYIFNGALGADPKIDSDQNFVKLDKSKDGLSFTCTADNPAPYVTISKDGNAYNIKTSSGYYIGGKESNSNGLLTSTTEKYKSQITYVDGNVEILANGGKTHFRLSNATSGTIQTRFRYYKTSSTTNIYNIQAYKLDTIESKVSTWVNKYMHMKDPAFEGDGTGACKNIYWDAKKELIEINKSFNNGFEETLRTNHTDAYARYLKWAEANLDATPFGTNLKTANVSIFDNDNTTSLIIIISVSILAISGIAIFAITRRKKLAK